MKGVDEHIDQCIIDIEYDSIECTLIFSYDDKVMSKGGSAPFLVLKEFRKEIEKESRFLICNGSRIDVHPSGMTSWSTMAYINRIGKPGTEFVEILDFPAEQVI